MEDREYQLLDEAVGSWHRFVDAIENISHSLTIIANIAEAEEEAKNAV